MKVKYNRVSTIQQSGNRFEADTDSYDLILFDRVSGTVKFRDRPEARKLIELVENGKVTTVVLEELSRIGRSLGDTISSLEWLDKNNINVIVRNLGIESRPLGKKNPVWGILTATLAGLYALELENIKERTTTGRMIFVQRGGKLGRPIGTNESEKKFLEKENTQKIIKLLNRGRSIREISSFLNTSTSTVLKVKKIGSKHNLIQI
ncbi:recombinase family protein [Algoriphagus kandeliae]|uniref:Recombinase family protein n=1 Tax=Algoriphagus kandeliae TaxID=2562278 RepID=A0A4Y9QPD4_9BACT|nr:recombinase family protein [Algoriphagus kandeliae]TFV94491.1 recombinase family protein [Algoriphagus kandeliae]